MQKKNFCDNLRKRALFSKIDGRGYIKYAKNVDIRLYMCYNKIIVDIGGARGGIFEQNAEF